MKEKINPKIIAVFALCLISVILAYGYNTYTKASEMEKSAVFNIPQMIEEVSHKHPHDNINEVVSRYIPLGADKEVLQRELKKNNFTIYIPKELSKRQFDYDEMFAAQKILSKATILKPVEVSFNTFYFFEKNKLTVTEGKLFVTGL